MDKCFQEICIFLMCVLFYECYGLNCRSGNDNKELELQRVYNLCQRRHNKEKYNNSQSSETSKEWYGIPNYRRTETYRFNHNHNLRTENARKYAIDLENQGRYDKNMDDVTRDQNRNNRFYSERSDGISNDRVINRPSYSYTGIGNSDDRTGYFWDIHRMNEQEDAPEDIDIDATRRRMDHTNAHGGKFFKRYNENIQSDTERDENINRRNKRSRSERNSGSRTQYNPNTKKQSTYYEDAGNDSNNKSNNEEKSNNACALHCYLDNLGMTTSDGIPDKYLVTHVLTKDINSEDLKDFLIESIEECFQILENEHTEDKCEFSNILLLCLSEKGKANCDDWRDGSSFKDF